MGEHQSIKATITISLEKRLYVGSRGTVEIATSLVTVKIQSVYACVSENPNTYDKNTLRLFVRVESAGLMER